MTLISRILAVSAAVILARGADTPSHAYNAEQKGAVMETESVESVDLNWKPIDYDCNDNIDCIDPMTNAGPDDISHINTPSGSYTVNNITRDASCIKFECDNNIIVLQNIDNDNIIVYTNGSDDPEIYALSQVDFE